MDQDADNIRRYTARLYVYGLGYMRNRALSYGGAVNAFISCNL